MTSGTESLTFALSRLARPATEQGRFDDVRLAMVDRLVESKARGALDGSEWLLAWRAAVGEVAGRVIDGADAAIVAAAARSRCPASLVATRRPTTEKRTVLLNRLLAEGIPLEELEGPEYQEQRRGLVLDEAWRRMTEVAAREEFRWSRVAAEVDAWRRPWRPLVIGATILVIAVTLLAALLGGIITPPRWFEPINDWFWSLPWP